MRLDVARPTLDSFHLGLLPRVALSSGARTLLATAAVGSGAFVVYFATLAPSVMWYDMGEFATTSATLGIAHNTGYPLLILLGKAFTFLPIGDTAYRVNLMSAVFTSLAVAVVFGIIHDLTDDIAASAIGALTLAFTSTVWTNATWATSYGLNLFFTALVTRLMLAWWRDRAPAALAGAALALGLGMGNHRLIVLVAAPSMLLIVLGWRALSARTVGLAALAFVAGLAVYAYLPIRGAQDPALSWARPANWHTYWSMFLNGQTPSDYWRLEIGDRISVLWTYPSYDLTWPGLGLGAVGLLICARQRTPLAAYFALLIVLDAVVVEAYSIHNIYNYLTPGYLGVCVLIGVASGWLLEAVRNAALTRLSVRPGIAVTAVLALLALMPAALVARNYSSVDRSDDHSAIDFAELTLDRLPARAVVLTDSWTAPPLWYAQLVRGERTDVAVSPIFSVQGADVVAFAQKQLADDRPVYVAEGLRTPLGELKEHYTLQPVMLDSIERMLVDVLPKPEYRDDLVATGSLYRVLPTPPDTTVEAVPAGDERDIAFQAGVTLAGFALDGDIVDPGSAVELTYYWRSDAPVAHDLRAVTLFFDPHGSVGAVRGYPLWSQSRVIGQGVLQTSAWKPGDIIRESYFALAPRTLAPGEYDIRMSVDDPGAPAPRRSADPATLKTIGHITVR